MSHSAEDILRQAKVQLEQAGHPQPACSPGALESMERTWPEEFGYGFPPEYADLVRIVNGGRGLEFAAKRLKTVAQVL